MDKLKTLFYNETLRRWHFKALIEASGLSRERVNHYLKQLVKDKLVKRVKPKGKMPYYIANRDNSVFRTAKKIYGLQVINESGLLAHIASRKGIKTAILFGSFARGDWSKSSDVDLFIYGDDKDFDKGKFEIKLGREIQIFNYKKPEKVKELDSKVIPNILKGIHLTESIEPFEVSVRG